MLLFKPAPIYILDEVDAALDLSHTQNIGQMLHTHFKHSQVWSWNCCDHLFTHFVIFRGSLTLEGSQMFGYFIPEMDVLLLSCFNWKLH